jgi:hypothetical protein
MTSAEARRLAQLTPETRSRVEQVIAAMGVRGFAVFVGDTLRTPAEQQAAIERGTTSAHQTRSWHFLGRAADLRKRNLDGSVDETTRDEAFFHALWQEARAVGLRSLAYRDDGVTKILINGKTWDAGHVEYREPFATIDEAFAAEWKGPA